MKDMKNPRVAFMLQSIEVSSFCDSFKIKNLINGSMSIFAAVLKIFPITLSHYEQESPPHDPRWMGNCL